MSPFDVSRTTTGLAAWAAAARNIAARAANSERIFMCISMWGRSSAEHCTNGGNVGDCPHARGRVVLDHSYSRDEPSMLRLIAAALLLIAGAPVLAQNYDPPPAKTPDAPTLKKIEEQTAKLKQAVADASKKVPKHEADLAIYVKAAEWIVRHQEWFTADSGKQTLAVIEQGLKRAEAAKEGRTPWLEVDGRSVARGYRSHIDGSVQPYGV